MSERFRRFYDETGKEDLEFFENDQIRPLNLPAIVAEWDTLREGAEVQKGFSKRTTRSKR